jgi:hypothetical protein
MLNSIVLATGKINNADEITVELKNDRVIINWPAEPTVVSPRKLSEVMSQACRILANASTELSRMKAGKRR